MVILRVWAQQFLPAIPTDTFANDIDIVFAWDLVRHSVCPFPFLLTNLRLGLPA